MLSPGNKDADAAWAAEASQCVAAALRSGSAKVQWNACHAAGQALRRSDLLCTYPAAATQLAALLDGLLAVLAGSANFKSRTQAAAALEGLSAVSVTFEQRIRAVEVLSHVLEIVHGRTPVEHPDVASQARTLSSLVAQHQDAALSPARSPNAGFSEVRYRAGLLQQLQQSLQHMQALPMHQGPQQLG